MDWTSVHREKATLKSSILRHKSQPGHSLLLPCLLLLLLLLASDSTKITPIIVVALAALASASFFSLLKRGFSCAVWLGSLFGSSYFAFFY